MWIGTASVPVASAENMVLDAATAVYKKCAAPQKRLHERAERRSTLADDEVKMVVHDHEAAEIDVATFAGVADEFDDACFRRVRKPFLPALGLGSKVEKSA